MANPLRWPLHVQIGGALILGVLAGLLLQLPSQRLPDGTLQVTRLESGAWTAQEIDASGPVSRVVTFISDRQLVQAWPGLTLDGLPAAGQGEVPLTGRALRVAPEVSRFGVTYSRQVAGQTTVVDAPFAGSSALKQAYPGLVGPVEEILRTWPATILTALKLVGDVFLRLLRMVTVPLVFFSLVTGVASMAGAGNVGRIFAATLTYYGLTSALAIVTGIALVNLIQPGIGAQLPGTGGAPPEIADQSLAGVFLGLLFSAIPVNPIEALASADFLAIISFSLLLGIFIAGSPPATRAVIVPVINALFEVVMRMTVAIVYLAPWGVFAFLAYALGTQGLEVFVSLGWYMLTVASGLAIHGCITLPLLVWLLARRSPWRYFQAFSPALLTAFSTASSNGTLPLTMTCAEQRAGISNRTASFVLPLGATVNMDGTALYEAVAVLFIAQASTGFELSLGVQATVAITALLASVGAAGIPHAGLVMMTIVLQAVGLPVESQALILAVDRVLDMGRTSINVWSDACGCAIIDRWFGGDRSPSAAMPTHGATAEVTLSERA